MSLNINNDQFFFEIIFSSYFDCFCGDAIEKLFFDFDVYRKLRRGERERERERERQLMRWWNGYWTVYKESSLNLSLHRMLDLTSFSRSLEAKEKEKKRERGKGEKRKRAE